MLKSKRNELDARLSSVPAGKILCLDLDAIPEILLRKMCWADYRFLYAVYDYETASGVRDRFRQNQARIQNMGRPIVAFTRHTSFTGWEWNGRQKNLETMMVHDVRKGNRRVLYRQSADYPSMLFEYDAALHKPNQRVSLEACCQTNENRDTLKIFAQRSAIINPVRLHQH